MVRLLIALVVVLGLVPLIVRALPGGDDHASVAAVAGSATATWTTDFEAARAAASAQGRDLLLDFTGSDWCKNCLLLHREVFSTPAFAAAGNRWVLVAIDFPQKKQQALDVAARNQRLLAEFEVDGFPTIILTDPAGRPYARTTYRPGGPERYLAHLDDLAKRKSERDAAFAAAATVTGPERARRLDAGLRILGEDMPLSAYQAEIDAIIAADADGTAGLKAVYIVRAARIAVERAAGPAAALAVLDGALATPGLTDQVRQDLLMMKAEQVFRAGPDGTSAALALYRAARAAHPQGSKVQALTLIIDRLSVDHVAGSASAATTR